MPLRHIHNHFCAHPRPAKWTTRPPFPLQGKRNILAIYGDMLIRSDSGWMSSYSSEWMFHSRTRALNDVSLRTHSYCSDVPFCLWDKRSCVNIDHHYPNMPSQSTTAMILLVKMCTLLEIPWRWLQITEGPDSSCHDNKHLPCWSVFEQKIKNLYQLQGCCSGSWQWPLTSLWRRSRISENILQSVSTVCSHYQ